MVKSSITFSVAHKVSSYCNLNSNVNQITAIECGSNVVTEPNVAYVVKNKSFLFMPNFLLLYKYCYYIRYCYL